MSGRSRRGFSMIELLIAIAIVAVLAAIAYPGITGHLMRSKRSVAHGVLLDIVRKQHQHLVDERRFGTLTELGYATETVGIDTDGNTVAAGTGIYDVALQAAPLATSTNIVATATATNAQAADSDCATLTLDADGIRTPVGDCW